MSDVRRREGHGSGSLRRGNPRLRWGDVPYSVAPYVPSPINVVKNMLKLAEAGPDDVVYDLGCGDGRILFTAVEEFGVKKAVGYDLNSTMCSKIRLRISEKGLEGRIEVVNGNFFLADLTPASIVTLYLTTSGNSKLKPKLAEELGTGARVVSHDFPINGWFSLKDDVQDYYQIGSHKIYLYEVPGAYEKKAKIMRTAEEESRWRRIRDLFLRDRFLRSGNSDN
jgi:SAM-dependent methyltransferase